MRSELTGGMFFTKLVGQMTFSGCSDFLNNIPKAAEDGKTWRILLFSCANKS